MYRYFLTALLLAYPILARAELLGEGERQAVSSFNAQADLPHEGRPVGVPMNYDWYAKPRLKKGNDPGSFRAMIGWGQVFWYKMPSQGTAGVQLRDMKVYMCHGEQRRWRLVLWGGIHGRQFEADFKRNRSVSVPSLSVADGVATVGFEYGTAFHFWPAMSRVELPDEPLCGFVVMVEARRTQQDGETTDQPGADLLLGLGADYWLDKRALWDNQRANVGIAVGRLKFVSDEWAWHGLSTASDEDVARLLSEGFTIAHAQRHLPRVTNREGT